MRAVVLVGGFGTRLRPLTNTSRSRCCRSATCRSSPGSSAASSGRRHRRDAGPRVPARAVPRGVPRRTLRRRALHYAVEPEPLDTAGAIRFAADHAGIDDTFVVANGDVLTDLDVATLLVAHRAGRCRGDDPPDAVDDPSAFGVVELDGDGRVVRFVEKPAPGTRPSNLINAGTYVFEPSVLDRIPSGRPVVDRARDVPGARRRAGRLLRDRHRRLLDRRRPPRAVPRRRTSTSSTGGGRSVSSDRAPAPIVDRRRAITRR